MVTVSKATESDMDVIMKFTSAIASHERANTLHLLKRDKLQVSLFGENPMIYCLIARKDGTACGYLVYSFEFSLFIVEEYVRINSLFVNESHRGIGIGKLLLLALQDVARQHKCPSVQCFTPDFNSGAIDFYKQMGANAKNAVRFYFDTGNQK